MPGKGGRLMLVTEQVLEVRGSDVRILVGGEGPPLLYLHDEVDLGEWLAVLEGLSASFTVVRPDLAGFNKSAGRSGCSSVHDLAFFTLDVMDALDLERASVVGAGLGGWLAADLATIEPGRVERLVLVGALGLRPPDGHEADLFLLDPVQAARTLYRAPSAVEQAVLAAERLAGDAELHTRYLRNRAALAHLGWNPYLHDPLLGDRLHRIAAPTLVVWGDDDRVVSPRTAERYAAAIGSARAVTIAGTGHLPHLEAPEAVLAEVAPFLAASTLGVA